MKELPVKCTAPLCLAVGSNIGLEYEPLKSCPYPLSIFPQKSTEHFLENNQKAIMDWLAKSFKQKNHNCHEVTFDKNFMPHGFYENLNGKLAICLVFSSQSGQTTAGFFTIRL